MPKSRRRTNTLSARLTPAQLPSHQLSVAASPLQCYYRVLEAPSLHYQPQTHSPGSLHQGRLKAIMAGISCSRRILFVGHLSLVNTSFAGANSGGFEHLFEMTLIMLMNDDTNAFIDDTKLMFYNIPRPSLYSAAAGSSAGASSEAASSSVAASASAGASSAASVDGAASDSVSATASSEASSLFSTGST